MTDSTRNLHIARTVLTLDCRRGISLNHTAQVTHLDSLTGRTVKGYILQILNRLTEWLVVAHKDIVLLAILTIVRCHSTIHTVAEEGCRSCNIQTIHRQLITVEYYLILRSVLITRNGNLGTSLNTEHLLLNLGSDAVGSIKIVAIELDIDRLLTSGTTLLSRLDNLVGTNLGVLVEVLTHKVANLGQSALTLGLFQKTDIHRDIVCSVLLHRGEGIVGIRRTLTHTDSDNLRIVLAELLVDTQRQIAGNLLTSTDRQLDLHRYTAVILCREELGLNHWTNTYDNCYKESQCAKEEGLAVIYAPTQRLAVDILQPAHCSIDILLHARLLRILLHNLRAKHRSKGQCGSHRNGQSNCYHPTHWLEEHTCHTLNHSQREEHRQGGQGRSDNRHTDLLCSKDCSLLNSRTTIDMSGNILQHHNRIIHDHTDRDRDSRHGDNVERRVGSQEVNQSREHRNWNCQHNDKHCTPTTKHHHYHKHNDDKGCEDGLHQRRCRIHNVIRHIDIWLHGNIRREILAQLFESFAHLLRDLHGIRIGLLLHNQHTASCTIVEGLLRTLLLGIGYGSHIAQIDICTIACANNDIEHLLGTIELLVNSQRIGVRADIHLTTRNGDILLCYDLGNLLDCHTVSFQLVRVAVDLNLTLRNTRYRHRTYTIDTRQRCGYTLVDNLVQTTPRLVGLDCHEHNRHLLGRELEDDWFVNIVRKDIRGDIEFVTNICRSDITIDSVLKFEHYDRDILFRLRMDMFQVLNAIESIFEWSGDILLDIHRTRTRIGRDDHDIGSLDVGKHIDRQFHQREDTKNRDSDKNQDCRYRIIDCCFVDIHCENALFFI